VIVFDSITYQFNVLAASCPNTEDGEISIETSSNNTYTYLWSNGSTTSINSNLSIGSYELTITDANNCIKEGAFELTSLNINCLNIPTAFSPNNDMVNDRWEIENISLYESVNIEIFNRWGQMVFSFSGTGDDYSFSGNQWDGTLNGKELPISSFVYILDLGEANDPINGVVTIKK
jgi:gliding motility-associated-like protein